MYKVFITSCTAIGLFILTLIVVFGSYLLLGYISRLIHKLKIFQYIKNKINFDWENTGVFVGLAVLIIYVFMGFYDMASKILG